MKKNILGLILLVLLSSCRKDIKMLLVVETPNNCVINYHYEKKEKVELKVMVDISTKPNDPMEMGVMFNKTYKLNKVDAIFLTKKLEIIKNDISHVNKFANDAVQYKLYINQKLKYDTYKSYEKLNDIIDVLNKYKPIYQDCSNYD